MRFLGFDLGARTPDANTIRLFREKLTETKTITVLFGSFDHRLRTNGYLAMGGQIVDATLVAAPKQRNAQEERDAIKAGKTAMRSGATSQVHNGPHCRKWQAIYGYCDP